MVSTIIVAPGQVLSDVSRRPMGINVNYLRDDDSNRPDARPLKEALRETGARHLRYPGGEKSDWHLFDPISPTQLGTYRDYARDNSVLKFDDFIKLTRDIGAVPHVVTAFDSFAQTGVTEDQFLENAVRWLTYSNITKKYAVRHWEIGNENWNNEPAPPQEMAQIVCKFSKAMKAVDSDILICASGNNERWWSEFLPVAAECIDRLVVSQYTGWEYKDYSYFANNDNLSMISCAENALACIDRYAPQHRERLKVIIAELNSMDYSKNGWAEDNNLGHSLVTFGILGQMLQQSRIEYGMLWNTRWMNQQGQYRSLFYGLDGNNKLLPSAMPLKIWSSFLKDYMVCADEAKGLMVFASADLEGKSLSVFLMNKGFEARQARVEVRGRNMGCRKLHVYAGEGSDDLHPRFLTVGVDRLEGDIILEPVSLTILEYGI